MADYHRCSGCGTYILKDSGKYCMLCKPKMQKAKLYVALFVSALVLAGAAGFALYHRGSGLYDCIMRQYEENRETDFSWWRGRCLYVNADGTKTPVRAARGILSGSESEADTETEVTE